ncbi:MAG: cobalamin B12-binding domain-containing protein [Pseudomonadota bacterium]
MPQDRTALPFDALETITRELVSRLNRKLPKSADYAAYDDTLSDEDLDGFCDALVCDDSGRFRVIFEDLRLRGRTLESLCLRCIAPAARRLGDRWVSDDAGFLEVTLGLTRLHGLQRQLRDDFAARNRMQLPNASALFSPVPGETHVLGVTMAADFFRRAGWAVDLNMAQDPDRIVEMVIAGRYQLVGFSAGCRSVIPDLESIIPRIRNVQPQPKIVLGGHLVSLEPDLVDRLGLDGAFTEVTTAPFSCYSLLSEALEC